LLSDFGATGSKLGTGSKFALSHYLAIGFYNSLYYRTSRDVLASVYPLYCSILAQKEHIYVDKRKT